jgi:anti-sigma28 factor (negative regulator of flagellin synthesis)
MSFNRISLIIFITLTVVQSAFQNVGALSAESTDESKPSNQGFLRRQLIVDEERHLQEEYYTSDAIAPLLQNNSCVSNDRQLRDAVRLAPSPTGPKAKPLLIRLCRPSIVIDPTIKTNGVSGINLSDRYIDFRCKLDTPHTRCTLDGQSKSRIFYGNNTKIFATGIDFLNANPPKDDPIRLGGALTFGKKSNITLIQCFLRKNNGRQGSAIAMDQSTLVMKGSTENNKLILSGNMRTVMKLTLSTATLDHVKFVKNKVEKGALRVDRSKVAMTNCVFYKNDDDVVGSDLYVMDNISSDQGGSYVACNGNNNIFCDGIGNPSILDEPKITNTNCKTTGKVGTPEKGVCVLA